MTSFPLSRLPAPLRGLLAAVLAAESLLQPTRASRAVTAAIAIKIFFFIVCNPPNNFPVHSIVINCVTRIIAILPEFVKGNPVKWI